MGFGWYIFITNSGRRVVVYNPTPKKICGSIVYFLGWEPCCSNKKIGTVKTADSGVQQWQEWLKKMGYPKNHQGSSNGGVNEPVRIAEGGLFWVLEIATFEGLRCLGYVKYFRCGVVPLFSEIWKRLMKEAQSLLGNGAGFHEHVSIFLWMGLGLGWKILIQTSYILMGAGEKTNWFG